ncbi:MAG: VOC family protein [Alphaproteobacteria bacterium]|nr:VOC family protein [Alphaproteobacteria bacterium]
MQRLHVHVAVNDLEKSIAFYSTLFNTAPAVLKPDYAKWMLDDPRVNFAISRCGATTGVDHLGIQVESDADLGAVAERLAAAGSEVAKQHQAACCYARSNKAWLKDPDGISWETFHTTAAATTYGEDTADKAAREPAPGQAGRAACRAAAPSRETAPAETGRAACRG